MQRPGLTQETVHGNLGLQMFLKASMQYSENLSLGNIPGNKWYVDAAKSGDGISWDAAFSDLDEALLAVGHNDAIFIAPGTYTGNYETPDETVARNVGIFGVTPGMQGIRGGVNLVPTSGASPIITNLASGWRYSNLCFRPGATSSAIKLVADQNTTAFIAGTADSISQGVTVDNCMIWGGGTGKYGIEAAGLTDYNGIHYANIINNHFMYLNATGAAAIYGAASGNPNIGWRVFGNQFSDNRSHINCAAAMGWLGSRFEGNTFPFHGVYAQALDMLVNVRATATPDVTGGNVFVNNFFGVTTASWATSALIRTNGYDHGMGNWCADGIVAAEINH